MRLLILRAPKEWLLQLLEEFGSKYGIMGSHRAVSRMRESCFEPRGPTVDSRKLEYGSGTFYAGLPSFLGLGMEDSHIPTFCLLL